MLKLLVSMPHNTSVDKNTLSLIANSEYDFYDYSQKLPVPERPTLTNAEYLELFEMASLSARKILGSAQDRASRTRIGSLYKSESRTKKLEIAARRFTAPVPLNVFNDTGSELYSRVTVTEHNRRSSPQERFHPTGYGAIAVKLFLSPDPEQEVTMHTAVSQQNDRIISVAIDNIVIPPAEGMPHMIGLLEQTRAALDG